MTASAARRLAREVVTRVREREAFAHETMASALSSRPLAEREAAFATRLAYGTVQTRGTLDEALDRFVERPRSVEPRVRDALCVASYELLFSSTPPRAAVNEGVELVRELRPAASGLANAVLRKLADSAPEFPWGDPDEDIQALARLHGHPVWLAEVLVKRFGRAKGAEIMAADNEAAPLYVAHNPFRGSLESARASLEEAEAGPLPCPVPGCMKVAHPAAAVRSAAVADGQVIITDAAAQLVPKLVHPLPGTAVVEIGAGRGTKTVLLQAAAVAAGGPAHITAVDDAEFKVQVLGSRMRDLGVPDISATCADARTPAAMKGAFLEGRAERVLVDAPCSGLGTLRRHPEQRWRLGPEDPEALAELASQLLKAAAWLCAPGGFVVYSTCTLTDCENERVVASFLGSEEGRGFAVSDIAGDVPSEWQEFAGAEGFFQSLPTPGGPDGHFAARLERRT